MATVREEEGGKDNNNNELYWLIEGGGSSTAAAHCKSGDYIKCGSMIRLKHINTGKYLHSHKDKSNLSISFIKAAVLDDVIIIPLTTDHCVSLLLLLSTHDISLSPIMGHPGQLPS
mmetsp:Transcript_23330/g.19315  ORF Transcript_23330/g.19315 Transcript_23330/m.19315 type:complete len:116 (+) Transcript_23330:26-373(+)